MVLKVESLSTRSETCSSAILSTNPKWTGLGSTPGLGGYGCVFIKRSDFPNIFGQRICWQRFHQRLPHIHRTRERMVPRQLLMHTDLSCGLYESWARRSTCRPVSDLSDLKYLDLRKNCLVSPLHNDLFKSLGQLRALKLDYNKLTTLDSKLLTPIANNITEITLSNNPFICDCSIRDAVEWFKRYELSSQATCEHPSPGESWNTLTFTGHCEFTRKPQVDLTCHIVSGSVQEDTDEPSDSFSLLLVFVVAICGFLLLLCGGLLLYCWRRATRNSTPNLDRRINENKHYDDIVSSDYYYYETVRPVPRYTSVVTSSRPGSTPEIPKRPQISGTEPDSFCQTRGNDDVGNVRNSVSDSDSYIQPENPTIDKETPAEKLQASPLAPSEVLKRSGDISDATEDNNLVPTKPLQSFTFQRNVTDEEKEEAISPLPSEKMISTSAIPEIIEFQHVQTQKSEYPWERDSFWKS